MMKRKSAKIPYGKSKRKQGPHRVTAEMSVLIVTGIGKDGHVIAVPEAWNGRRNPPHIMVNDTPSGPAVGMDDRFLARLRRISLHQFHAQVVRILPKEATKRIVGIFIASAKGGGVIEPVSHKIKESYLIGAEHTHGALSGEVVSGMVITDTSSSHGMQHARIEERLGLQTSPHAVSLIAAHIFHLPMAFSASALAEATRAPAPQLTQGREDLRAIPLVTIDGEDARDFDDAVFAEPDESPDNPGGFHLIIAISDVACYVAAESALDKEAFERGNSVYFPDRVIPMLPEHLSNGICSLKPNEDRNCVAVHLWIDAQGVTKRYRFTRALMRSYARLTYTHVEEMYKNGETPTHMAGLFAAYGALKKERDTRGTLNIQLPEYKVMFGPDGKVERIAPRAQWESHRLIEAFMVAANVAAANYLLKHRAPGIFRVHEPPSEEKILNLRNFFKLSGYALPKGTLAPVQLNRVLEQAKHRTNAQLVNTMVLRSQMQAYYSDRNLGHYGLALKHYCHFTSPIRRYSDLVVHRSLVALMEKEKHPATTPDNLTAVSVHISETERLAMGAERDAMDRYRISYMMQHVGEVFAGSITGVSEYGLYVTLAENGITGFVPVSQLGREFFVYNKGLACFQARSGKQRFALGDGVNVRVVEANATRSNLIFKPEAGHVPSNARPGKDIKKQRPQKHFTRPKSGKP